MKKVLVLGGTGAMGRYTVPALASLGYQVDVVAKDTIDFGLSGVNSYVGDCMDRSYLSELLKNGYDGIIDYMIYKTPQFAERFTKLLECTDHYIFLSTYRVYDGACPVREDSPLLLNTSCDREYLKTEDYSLFKARCENILGASKYKNYTIVRPSITYSTYRYQLTTLEAKHIMPRTALGKRIVLPEEARNVQGTMTWAGDTAKMFAGLLFNERALTESYTLSTAEHHTWGEIAEYYTDIIGSRFEWVDTDTYLKCISQPERRDNARYQLVYDRLFERVIDNGKILRDAGLTDHAFTSLYEGLKTELSKIDISKVDWQESVYARERMDAYFRGEALTD